MVFSLEKQSWPAELKPIVMETSLFIRHSYEDDFLERHRSGDESTKRLNKIKQIQENAFLWGREKARREEFEQNMKNGVPTPDPDETSFIKESKLPPLKFKTFESISNLNSRQLSKLNRKSKSKKGSEGIVIIKQITLKSKKTTIEPKSAIGMTELPVLSMMKQPNKQKSEMIRMGTMLKRQGSSRDVVKKMPATKTKTIIGEHKRKPTIKGEAGLPLDQNERAQSNLSEPHMLHEN